MTLVFTITLRKVNCSYSIRKSYVDNKFLLFLTYFVNENCSLPRDNYSSGNMRFYDSFFYDTYLKKMINSSTRSFVIVEVL